MCMCVKLNGEDLSRYSNKIETAGLRIGLCSYYHYLIPISDAKLTNISQSIDRHGMKKLRRCHDGQRRGFRFPYSYSVLD